MLDWHLCRIHYPLEMKLLLLLYVLPRHFGKALLRIQQEIVQIIPTIGACYQKPLNNHGIAGTKGRKNHGTFK